MSEHRQRIDPITAEHLVRGVRADAHGSDPLAQLLAAATSPARRDELAGEEAAVTAFRAANLARPPSSRRRSMLSAALAKLATAKAAIAVIAVAGGGIALAAGSGNLPGVNGSNPHPTAGPGTGATTGQHQTHTSTAATSSAATSRDSAVPGRSSTPKGSSTANGSSAPNGSPAPNLRGLCTAYAHAKDNPGKALDNPAFTVLINAAGGKAQVASFCSNLLGDGHAPPSTHPGNGKSTHGAPSTHHTGGPGSSNSSRRSAHPSKPKSTPSHPSPPSH